MIDKILDDVILQIAKSNADTSEYVNRLLNVMEYDVLHTQGKEYLVEDITDFVREKGVNI